MKSAKKVYKGSFSLGTNDQQCIATLVARCTAHEAKPTPSEIIRAAMRILSRAEVNLLMATAEKLVALQDDASRLSTFNLTTVDLETLGTQVERCAQSGWRVHGSLLLRTGLRLVATLTPDQFFTLLSSLNLSASRTAAVDLSVARNKGNV